MTDTLSARSERTALPGLVFSLLCLALVLGTPPFLSAETLQSVFDSALPQLGYDRYVVLEPGVTYTGGLTIPTGTTVCISGNSAILDLGNAMVNIQGAGTRLDIDYCVIMNGGEPALSIYEGALNFVGSGGNVINNTFYGNTVGIRVYLTGAGMVRVKNNIIVRSSAAGLLCELGSEPVVSYNDAWANLGYGNYAIDCG